ncbi:recombinase family protein [Mucilaginibacter sp. P25]|uniref:recombinase family protein n=1 Tax=Mucilaginibacter sp. P25 TaxID=3423945 RepID=UPI003D7C0A2F
MEYQEKNIRDYCEYNHIALNSIFVDDGASSFTFDRPDYKALEKFIKEHRGKVKYLIVLDHDRFSRNLPEALQKIEQLEKTHGIKVVATSEPLDIDTSDPSVFLLRAFKYLIANQELLTIRRRAKMSARHAQESGRYLNKAPYGLSEWQGERWQNGFDD